MAEVRALTDGQWTYPTYQAWRNGGKIIQKFKQSGNGVLFAAGSCWEGIDFPGDMVSLPQCQVMNSKNGSHNQRISLCGCHSDNY